MSTSIKAAEWPLPEVAGEAAEWPLPEVAGEAAEWPLAEAAGAACAGVEVVLPLTLEYNSWALLIAPAQLKFLAIPKTSAAVIGIAWMFIV